jgi:hypothetical protein
VLGADDSGCAGAIVDDDVLAQHFAKALRDRTAKDVGLATRRERHDHPDRLAGEVFLRRSARDDEGGNGRAKQSRQAHANTVVQDHVSSVRPD